MMDADLYRVRFSPGELTAARAFWKPIARYLQRYIPKDGTVLDLGAGFCHFINNIEAGRKIALDFNAANLAHADAGVEKLLGSAHDLASLPPLDTVFASNVYEHLPSREAVYSSIRGVFELLKPGGRFIVLQPNFAHCAREYFDFFDHRLIFTHKSMAEALTAAGFEIEVLHARFLPFTSKNNIPKAPWLVALYLRVPLAWKVMGGQMLIVARKP